MPHYTPFEMRERIGDAPLRTTELRVSVPIINRHMIVLEQGRPSPSVKVGDGTVIGGVHWYVAGYLVGRMPRIERVPAPPPETVRYSFRQVVFEAVDWENMMGRRP